MLGLVPLGSDTACHKVKMFRFTVWVDFLPLLSHRFMHLQGHALFLTSYMKKKKKGNIRKMSGRRNDIDSYTRLDQ